jgi:hypothetical protein
VIAGMMSSEIIRAAHPPLRARAATVATERIQSPGTDLNTRECRSVLGTPAASGIERDPQGKSPSGSGGLIVRSQLLNWLAATVEPIWDAERDRARALPPLQLLSLFFRDWQPRVAGCLHCFGRLS